VQGDVDQNEIDSDAADVTLQTNINTVQGDVDQNETDSDAADATLQTNINTVQGDVDQNEADADAAILVNANNIIATDYFDQTGSKLAAGTGETWTELEAATGTFTTNASAGTLTLAGGSITDSNGAVDFGDENLSTTGTLGAGTTTLSSTLNVTGAGEFDSSLGVDGNLRVGSGGASTFQVNGTSGALSTSGDISTSGGVQASTAIVTGTALLQGTTTASTMSVSNFLTLNNEPLLDSHAATKLYVDTEIDSHTHDMPQAFSYVTDGTYTSLGADLSASAVTITVTGTNLAAGTYKLHLDGNEITLTATVNSATEVQFDLTDTDVSGMFAGRVTTTGLFATQLSIDGLATGLTIFVNL
jgi:hypothetical protein